MHDDQSERAVSEVIAFILVFSIIIGSVGILYMTGFSAMQSFQEGEQLRNSEFAMVALGNNLNDVQRSSGVNERAGEIVLRDGSLEVGDDGAGITVSDNDGALNGLNDRTLGTLTYELDNRQIAYEGGGVFRGESDGNVALEAPQMQCLEDEGTAVISVMILEGSDQTQRTDGVQVTAVEQDSERYIENINGDLEVSVGGSEYDDGWDSFIDDEGFENGCDVDRAIVTITTVAIEF